MSAISMELENVLKEALFDIEPMLRSAGRSIRLVEMNADSCTIELGGFCGGCACTENYTAGIEEIIRSKAPDVKDIRFIQV